MKSKQIEKDMAIVFNEETNELQFGFGNEYYSRDELGFEIIDWDDEEAQKIMKECPESTPYIEDTCKDVETENYTFSFTRYPSPYFCKIKM